MPVYIICDKREREREGASLYKKMIIQPEIPCATHEARYRFAIAKRHAVPQRRDEERDERNGEEATTLVRRQLSLAKSMTRASEGKEARRNTKTKRGKKRVARV